MKAPRSLALGAGAFFFFASFAAGCRSHSPMACAEPCVPAAAPAHSPELPGAPSLDDAASAKIRAAWEARPAGYVPRTRHLLADGSPKYTNRLFLESSPYLRQHAHNPVNWFPWGDEAFETAKRLGRPVLLSIGYSTCHWCHVMEEESFEDEDVARAINEGYVPIKVDREERPDLDDIYMAAVEALTGSGGWPMTVWLTADRKPFAGGTYFPPRDRDRGARAGLTTLLREHRTLYAQDRARVEAAADDLAARIREGLGRSGSGSPAAVSAPAGTQPLVAATREYEARFDAANGGLVGAPKFPSSLPIGLLLRYYRRSGDAAVLRMATVTLEKMAAGGIRDGVGGGFHRYSTDARWRVPHFEKMLYDNALLAVAYVEAYEVTGRDDFAGVAREILRYVERDMTSPEGAFYAATDADSRGPDGRLEEGRFFTWTPGEIEAAVGHDSARLVDAYYQVTPAGNLEGRTVLSAPRALSDVARDVGMSTESARTNLAAAVAALFEVRSRRTAPFRDEKIIAAWNGLMIGAYAKAAFVFHDAAYQGIAERAADFVLTRMRDGSRLSHSRVDGRPGPPAYLDDYAFVLAGLLDLYEASSDVRWLKEAIALDLTLREEFEDVARGGYFLTASGASALLAREKPSYDGAEPSGNSVQALNLLRLSEITSQDEYRARAQRALGAFEDRLTGAPTSLSEMLLAVDFATDRAKEIVVVAPPSASDAPALMAKLRRAFVPNRAFVRIVAGADAEAHAQLSPLVQDKRLLGGRAAAYVCEAQACKLPTSDPEVLAAQLRDVSPLP